LGKTLNISAGGILFETKDPLPQQGKIHLAIDWPVLLDGVCHLRLMAKGCVVRGGVKGAAVKVSSYEFRTGSGRTIRV